VDHSERAKGYLALEIISRRLGQGISRGRKSRLRKIATAFQYFVAASAITCTLVFKLLSSSPLSRQAQARLSMKQLIKVVLGFNAISLIHLIRLKPKQFLRACISAFRCISISDPQLECDSGGSSWRDSWRSSADDPTVC
jgi:hypothetical protein